ncbi:hypothetical protein A6V36_35500 [Paraburkholderia ginsengiterrae]|uniref:Uncharacterized protein n=1 Tax=Paraburkholderia ginsengiterrae TaxID=1462993 RepID=A0ABX2UPP3_9BURK|nr:hypothetical protein A6V36_35500 [Paraburkholderia ginsengiterrae]
MPSLRRTTLCLIALCTAFVAPFAVASDAIAAADNPTVVSALLGAKWRAVSTQTMSAGRVDFVPKALVFLAR